MKTMYRVPPAHHGAMPMYTYTQRDRAEAKAAELNVPVEPFENDDECFAYVEARGGVLVLFDGAEHVRVLRGMLQ